MGNYTGGLLNGDTLINVISCVFTVAALIFTLYFWLLDHLSSDESTFISKRTKTLKKLRECLETISSEQIDPVTLRDTIKNVSSQMEVVLNYRFWGRSKLREEYLKINEFNRDSRYLVSALNRSIENESASGDRKSLVAIDLNPEQIEDIRTDYYDGLLFIIEFIETWE